MEKELIEKWENSGLIGGLGSEQLEQKEILINVFEKIAKLLVAENSQNLSKKLNVNIHWLEKTYTIIFPIVRKIYSYCIENKYSYKESGEIMRKIDVENLIFYTNNSMHILSGPMENILDKLDYEAEMATLISKNYFKRLVEK